MYKPTKADVAMILGATLGDSIRNRDVTLGGFDIAVLAESFIQATIKAAKPADRAVLVDVSKNEDMKNAWIAKAVLVCERQFNLVMAVCPERKTPMMKAAGLVA